jgi:hypothetical protein
MENFDQQHLLQYQQKKNILLPPFFVHNKLVKFVSYWVQYSTSHKLSVGAISEKIKFTLEIMVLCDVTPFTLIDSYIQRHENITSYQFEVYGLSEHDVMYKGDRIFTNARTSSLLKYIFILFIPCNKTCFILLKTNN